MNFKYPLATSDQCADLLDAKNRTIEDVAYDQEVGRYWLKALKTLPLNRDAHVIELAPGDRVKVGYGFHYYGFRGGYTLVDLNPFALEVSTKRTRALLPEAQVDFQLKKFSDWQLPLGKTFDLTVANHPLDDFILGHLVTEDELTKVFGTKGFDQQFVALKEVWRRQSPEALEKAITKTVNEFVDFIIRSGVESVIIAQYPSYRLSQQKFFIPDQSARKALRLIKERLMVLSFEEIRVEGLQKNHWLVMKKQTDG